MKSGKLAKYWTVIDGSLSYTQVCGIFAFYYFNWPSTLYRFFRISSAFNLNLKRALQYFKPAMAFSMYSCWRFRPLGPSEYQSWLPGMKITVPPKPSTAANWASRLATAAACPSGSRFGPGTPSPRPSS